ncbi:cytochrome p450 [Stylonychia lemnae]|uniref:Cytochrome p450 n=1 Tax=Stylonychia lemnae TaxID=5949 RepID=A0A078ATM8_STYLE|nr:cytochrome p450 [Stylonychia lemnae]|eukprot:CDW84567.1 cytochrome p450 [Stylonychia lemnae]
MYYKYWFYTSQGIKSTGFPIPIIGKMFALQNEINQMTEFSEQPIYEYYRKIFQGEKIPNFFIDFRLAEGTLVVSDPDILQELFVTKAKQVDKHYRLKTLFYDLTGESILFDKTTESQGNKRKRLSVAFYKDKMTQNLIIIIKKTFAWVQAIKKDIKEGNNERELSKMINDHIMDCILASVFGETDIKQTVQFQVGDKTSEISIGVCVGKLFLQLARKMQKPHRIFTKIFDTVYIGKEEKILQKNLQTYRNFLQSLIDKRRQQIKDSNYSSTDFLSLLLSDDLFCNDNNLIKDEISTFMLASTQTTATLITNLLYYYEYVPGIKQKLRDEICSIMRPDNAGIQNPTIDQLCLTPDNWIDKLGYDQLQDSWKYLYLLIQESMRIEPPVRASSLLQVNQQTNIAGYEIKPDIPISVHFLLLHTNQDEWQEPDKFIPERFDPESPYFLNRSGKKRKPQSFSPFLGGRRICLGKTFAENIAKIIVPLIVSEIEFKFKRPIHYERKPKKGLSTEINVPIILSNLKFE